MEDMYRIQPRIAGDCYISCGSLPCARNSEYTVENSVHDIKYNVASAPGAGLPYS
jgi:hypothetical protein